MAHDVLSSMGNEAEAKRMKKVVVFANTAWNLKNFRAGLIGQLVAEGYKVVLVAGKKGETDEPFILDMPCAYIRLSPRGRNPFTELFSFCQLAMLMIKERPDYCLTFTIKPNLYTGLIGRIIPFTHIMNITGLGQGFAKDGLFKKILIGLFRLAISKRSFLFFQNQQDKDIFLESGLGAEEFSGLLPGSGVDLQKFAYHERVVPVGEPTVFLFCGRLLRSKGVDRVVRAVKTLYSEGFDVRLNIVGIFETGFDAIKKDEIEDWADGQLITFEGEQTDVRPSIRRADCVVLPTAYPEGSPRILIESAAIGRPAIASRTKGCKDIIIDELTGLLCIVRDDEDLLRQMRRIVDMGPEKRRTLGVAGRKYMESHYDETIIIDSYLHQMKGLSSELRNM